MKNLHTLNLDHLVQAVQMFIKTLSHLRRSMFIGRSSERREVLFRWALRDKLTAGFAVHVLVINQVV